jgi:hypothetical protein
MNQALIARTLAQALGGPDAAHARRMVAGSTSRGKKDPFYPLISYLLTFPKYVHWFLRGEARPVPV